MNKFKQSNALGKQVHWWSENLAVLRSQARLYRRKFQRCYKRIEKNLLKTQYKKKLAEYKREINISKNCAWVQLCDTLNIHQPFGIPYYIAVNKYKPALRIASLKYQDGSYTKNIDETINYFLQYHFPFDTTYGDLSCHYQERKVSLYDGNKWHHRNYLRGCPQGSMSGPLLWNIIANIALNMTLPQNYPTTEHSCIQLPVQDQDFKLFTKMFAKNVHRTLSPDTGSRRKIRGWPERQEDEPEIPAVPVQNPEIAPPGLERFGYIVQTMRAAMKPAASFDGKTAVINFLEKLDSHFMLYPVNEFQKVALATSALKGQALNWFKCVGKNLLGEPGSPTYTYENFKNSLVKAFPIVRDRARLEAELFSRYQEKIEDLSNFILRKIQVFKLLYRNRPDSKIIQIILPRLLPQVQDFIELRNPTTLDNLFELAVQFESRRTADNERRRQFERRSQWSSPRPQQKQNQSYGNKTKQWPKKEDPRQLIPTEDVPQRKQQEPATMASKGQKKDAPPQQSRRNKKQKCGLKRKKTDNTGASNKRPKQNGQGQPKVAKRSAETS
ncbi:hypothetical protein X975_15165, partial [Stegodyphus mimosarum]